ncbi:hypothetical protein [Vibrio parahaemolyticus]|uniref:hypothetical protein n=1 Tax=Vibrio parahaemolyticus TaxID=670 RepID=UPI0004DFAF3D|nr:hypothetical protein [Vibrio parahaemolyticus]
MFYSCNRETENMTQAQLQAYYEGANSALVGNSNNPNLVFENPPFDIGEAFRKGHAAQLGAMASDSSII